MVALAKYLDTTEIKTMTAIDKSSKDEEMEEYIGSAISPTAIDISGTGSSLGSNFSAGPVRSTETVNPISSYQIKPNLENKFKERPVQEIIRHIVNQHLLDKSYDKEKVKTWTTDIANAINLEVKTIGFKRYKHIVQVIIGERTGAGVKSGVKCLWDSETDSYTSDIFMNDTMFCVTAVFAIYFY